METHQIFRLTQMKLKAILSFLISAAIFVFAFWDVILRLFKNPNLIVGILLAAAFFHPIVYLPIKKYFKRKKTIKQ